MNDISLWCIKQGTANCHRLGTERCRVRFRHVRLWHRIRKHADVQVPYYNCSRRAICKYCTYLSYAYLHICHIGECAIIICQFVRSTVHVPSDTLTTWIWCPTHERYLFLRTPQGPGSGPPPPKCYPRQIIKINREITNQRKPSQNKIWLMFYHDFHFPPKWK